MKILAIRIKNLASLEGETKINFMTEPLCSAGIFAITGATGAGKSTILDALCLALYGKTPRYVQAKEMGIEIQDVQGSTLSQGDVRGILRDGTAEGFAEVDFVGIDGQLYRSTWSVRRARNKAEGSIQADSVTLKNITSHIDIPGKKAETYKEIERLVGLNFEQFTRSVLLAQGDFTAFMKANKDEKSSLLEKLTGTHVYSEISKKIFEKFKFEEQQLRDLNFRKEGIATLNEEELKTLLEEQGILKTQIKDLEKEIEKLTTEINWHEQLVKLQGSYFEANTALQSSVEVKVNAYQRRQKLLVTEQAQQTRSWADAQKHAQQQHIEKETILDTLQVTIISFQEQKKKLEIQLLASETDLKEKNKALNDTLPLLEQARKLDTLLAERKDQADNAQKDVESVSANVNQHQKVLTEKQTELTNVSDKIKITTDWKIENADRSPIADNRNIILSKLQDAQKLLEILQSSTKELDILKHKINSNETDKTTTEANLDLYTKEWESLKKAYDLQSKELLLIPIETLNLDKVEADRNVENTIKAQGNWQLLYNAITDLETLNKKQVKDQSDYKTKEKTLGELAQKLVVELAEKDTASQLLKHAQLASAENVETLRETLIDDEPCPVCGSTSHPYAVHNPQLENVLSKLEEVYNQKDQLYLVNYREYIAFEQVFKTLEETIQSQSEVIKVNEAALENKKQAWDKFNISKENPSISEAKMAEFIEERLKNLKTKQAELFVKIQDHDSQKQQLEASKIKIEQHKETVDNLTSQVKDLKTSIALYNEQQSGKIKEKNKTTLDLSEIEKVLSHYFTNSDWMENWKSAPSVFLDSINSFTEIWKENTEKFMQYTLQKGAFEATLKELENQTKSLLAEFAKKTAAHTTLHQNYLDIKQQRENIFEGKSAEEVEGQIKQAVTEAQKQLDQLKEIQQQLSTNNTKANTQKEELIATLGSLEKEVQKTSRKIEIWLSDYNGKNDQSLDLAELHELLILDNYWIENERTALKIIDDEVTKATSVLVERKQLLDVHQQMSLSERPLDDLNVLITAAKSNIELQKHKKGEIGFQVQQDETNKNKIGDLLISILAQAKITENWSKLNEIIGSADGKKFRQIAQEYTLDVLLGYANIHLQVLTSRYKIERIPTTLGLQVVDHDMGDEVRTVYSLSGGESFLVSLALALGLASLSSSRMKVESLFIDEGFGSLDPTTLNIAMDALERLHNQGRKVGVISHVQEMTERIPVQIKVSKQQSGKSMVEVLG
ncbi:AAA family ATPase [Flavobacterium sp. LS1R49]|uniref:AAA family ATPase n=1 Tax=Flavobacterium shii TaxID=2987687 RepID=A0A9X3C3Y5_9FLAO|nr:AAA family ATPase [Flavobacterium shii]MCV9926249.1 AAA family ATPase [Flavobacterium shii]